jgi:hypothetical protein
MRKTRKQTGGNMAQAQRRIDKWVTDGDVDNFLDLNNLDLTSLPKLPDNLKKLNCSHNKLARLPTLTDNLNLLFCDNNKLTTLPKLPDSLELLICNKNKLTELPKLPDNLEELFCHHNKLTRLPTLPNSLRILLCDNNKLTTLPKLPDSLEDLYCNNNNLPSIFYMTEEEKNEFEDDGWIGDYTTRIRKLQKSRKNLINSFKPHITEKKRNNLANRNSKYPRNVMKSIANYMDEEDLENININSLKPKNVKRGETKKQKK